ncbi:MAG: hypothetical protein DRN05_01610 [Thermoplasmata archaeon]|nr:MAG: hypothetical protein DRN05_01610 [Thermoplasmata archaeon]
MIYIFIDQKIGVCCKKKCLEWNNMYRYGLFRRIFGAMVGMFILLSMFSSIGTVALGYDRLMYTGYHDDMGDVEYFAVIVTGGAAYAPNQALATRQTEEAYDVLRTWWHYTDDTIYYLNPDPDYNPSDYEVDAVASPETIQYAISIWLDSMMDDNDVGFIYMIDHGQDGGHFNIDENGDGYLDVETEYIKNVELGFWIDSISSYGKLVIVIECCYSGDFLPYISGVNRIGITSTDGYTTSGIGIDGWSYFSHSFFTNLKMGYSVEQAFEAARNYVLMHAPGQHPLIDDQCLGSTYIGHYYELRRIRYEL